MHAHRQVSVRVDPVFESWVHDGLAGKRGESMPGGDRRILKGEEVEDAFSPAGLGASGSSP
jgi:hypothetical protein